MLHVAPESSVGGPIGLVRNGDRIRLSVSEKTIDLLVDENELAQRRSEPASPDPDGSVSRGYGRLYAQEVLQADQGCDFAFMKPTGEHDTVGG